MVKVRIVAVMFAAVAAGGCAGADGSDEEAVAGTDEMLRSGRRLSQTEVADTLRAAGFHEQEIPRMVCTAKFESDFYERAVGSRNRNGTVDRGLFQINSVHLGRAGCPKTGDGLFSARANARCALVIWRTQSNEAWYGYQKHRAECDAFVLDAHVIDE